MQILVHAGTIGKKPKIKPYAEINHATFFVFGDGERCIKRGKMAIKLVGFRGAAKNDSV
jgi:hypothetical protein